MAARWQAASIAAGMDTRDHGPGELAARVGSVFQDPETQVVMGAVRGELAFGLENLGHSAAAVARGVEEAALALGIGGLLERETATLSGGELQRVAVGAALAVRPSLLLLDEPTSQLDPVAGDELMAVLRRLNEDLDVAIVLAEHRLERCLAAADRVIALDDGRVVCDATPGEFLRWAPEELQTPGARLLRRLGISPVAGVKAARAALRDHHIELEAADVGADERPSNGGQAAGRPALAFRHVWHELRDGPVVLRDVDLQLQLGERVALMGRNGAGKSTLLRHAAGLMKPTRGRVQSDGEVALLLQNPGDYLVHETVAQEASPQALALVGLAEFGDRNPRDLSAGERQRLALAVVLDAPQGSPAVICLDEPTRGMDRRHKRELAATLISMRSALLVATHDPEFAAAFAQRVILLADGAPIADASADEVLTGGTYFATETARIAGLLTPERALVKRHDSGGGAVSWQLGAFLILAVALAGGFAWYERSRPDTRIVALVGTLAAFAVLGRIAFAALPNVKPTTDIVLVTGYALGGAPGFATGAIAGLTSNFFFGQGPWTPWQMAGWGVTGLIGAGLALAAGRRPSPNRWLLAVICGAVGFAFTAFQDFGDWITYSDHSLAQLGVYVGKGIGFDLVHAFGCVAFALAFGPALARSVARFALRLKVTWLPLGEATPRVTALAIVFASLSAGALAGAGIGPRAAQAAATPAGYLLAAQNQDGGFGPGPGSSSTSLYSGWAALGLAAAGHNPRDVRHGGASLSGYLVSQEGSATDPGSLERTILALRAGGLPAGNLVGSLRRDIGGDGSVSNQVNLTAFAVLALRAAGVAPPGNMLALAGPPAGLRRRLQLRHQRGIERRRRHGRRARGTGRRLRRGRGACRSLHRLAAELGRRLSQSAGRVVERPVDGVGRPGTAGGRRGRRRGQPGSRLPPFPGGARRPHPLFARER